MQTTNIWINEFQHVGAETAVVEVTFEGAPGDANAYAVQVWFLPSADPTVTFLGEALVSAFSAGQSINGVTFASRTIGSTQDLVTSWGLVLYATTTNAIVEFLVTGDTFSPDSGPASGQTPTQIPAGQLGSTHWYLLGAGCDASAFAWAADSTPTLGSLNTDQMISGCSATAPSAYPSSTPSCLPSLVPSEDPSSTPSKQPSLSPFPSNEPSNGP